MRQDLPFALYFWIGHFLVLVLPRCRTPCLAHPSLSLTLSTSLTSWPSLTGKRWTGEQG